MKKQENTKQKLFEMMSKLDPTFKPVLNETWENKEKWWDYNNTKIPKELQKQIAWDVGDLQSDIPEIKSSMEIADYLVQYTDYAKNIDYNDLENYIKFLKNVYRQAGIESGDYVERGRIVPPEDQTLYENEKDDVIQRYRDRVTKDKEENPEKYEKLKKSIEKGDDLAQTLDVIKE